MLANLGEMISIHAPREGSDQRQARRQARITNFYPRSPRGERPLGASLMMPLSLFLSTLPARGATFGDFYADCINVFLSTLPARGATLRIPRGFLIKGISIHAPREGSDGRSTE